MPKGISEAGKECRKAKKRLLVIYWPEHKGYFVKQTYKYFDISKRKFYLWKKRQKEYEKFLETLPSPEKVQKFLEKTRWYWLLSPRSRKRVKLVGRPDSGVEVDSFGKRKEFKTLKDLPKWYGQLELSKRPKKWQRK